MKTGTTVPSANRTRLQSVVMITSVVLSLFITPGVEASPEQDTRITELIEGLKDSDYQTREANAGKLAKACHDDVSAIPLLVQGLERAYDDLEKSFSNLEQFEALTKSLEPFGTQAHDAIPTLRRMLKSRHEDISHSVALALGSIGKGSPEAVQSLLEALHQQPDADLRFLAASALGQMEATQAIPDLIAALKDRDANVRIFTAGALGDFSAETLEGFAGHLTAVVQLKLNYKRLAPIDAASIGFRINFGGHLEIAGEQCDTNFKKFTTADDAMHYVITTPNGEDHTLDLIDTHADSLTYGERLGSDTFRTLSQTGVSYVKDEPRRFRWKGEEAPAFDTLGTHKLKISGTFTEAGGSNTQIPFETNEVSYEIDPKFASFASLVGKARGCLFRELGDAASKVEGTVSENLDGNKLVEVYVGKALYPESKNPVNARRHQGEYYGGSFEYQFTPEGEYIKFTFRPQYVIVDY